MAKVEYVGETEVPNIVEAILDKHGSIFDGFDKDKIFFIRTMKKRGRGCGIKTYALKYPYNVRFPEIYVFEVFDDLFSILNTKQKNLAVFHAMSCIPQGGFDPESKKFGKIKKPDIGMFMTEFAVAGCVPTTNGIAENPAAKDPLE